MITVVTAIVTLTASNIRPPSQQHPLARSHPSRASFKQASQVSAYLAPQRGAQRDIEEEVQAEINHLDEANDVKHDGGSCGRETRDFCKHMTVVYEIPSQKKNGEKNKYNNLRNKNELNNTLPDASNESARNWLLYFEIG